jgi:hypothetical protein
MGLWLEARQRAMCRDLSCVARTAVEAVFEKIGVYQNIEEYAEKLAEVIEEEHLEEPYIFTLGNLKITIYDVDYDVDCTNGCESEIKVKFEVDGDIKDIKPVIKKVLKDMGVDIEICE